MELCILRSIPSLSGDGMSIVRRLHAIRVAVPNVIK